jgi:hypothetical protein
LPRISIQDQIIDVSEQDFPVYLQIWVEVAKNFAISCCSNHFAGLADFNGRLFQNWYEDIRRNAILIEPEIEDDNCLKIFHEFLTLLEKTWKYDQEIVNEYTRLVHLDISVEGNRKKLQQRVKKYRFGDISKGVSVIVPESVLKIGEQSTELMPLIKKMADDLKTEFIRTFPG